MNGGRDSFDDLPWHDAELLSVEVDRRRAGHVDEVVIVVRWPDATTSRIRFLDCWRLEALMNFGIVAVETVLSAWEDGENEGVRRIQDTWGPGANVHDLRCFVIETNSTGGTITVYARQWVEEPHEAT